jgi:hypothetical protein
MRLTHPTIRFLNHKIRDSIWRTEGGEIHRMIGLALMESGAAVVMYVKPDTDGIVWIESLSVWQGMRASAGGQMRKRFRIRAPTGSR